MTGPGTAATARPSWAAKSAVISEPERSVASTTTVSAGEPGDEPVAREEAPAVRREARRQLGDHAAARRRSAACRRALARRVRHVGAAGEHGDRRRRSPAARSAPSRVGGRVDAQRHAGDDGQPAAARPRPSDAGDLEPVGRAAARADDRDAARAPRARRVAGDVQHGRRVGELAQRGPGSAAAQRQTALRPAAAIRSRARPASKAPRSGALRRPSRSSASSSSSGSASTPAGARGAATRCRAARQRGDQVGAPQAGVARRRVGRLDARHCRRTTRRLHGRSARRVGPPRRALSAGRRVERGGLVDVLRRTRAAARSATVRATRRTRPWPRALRRSRSWSS